jgi:hypothetical protein
MMVETETVFLLSGRSEPYVPGNVGFRLRKDFVWFAFDLGGILNAMPRYLGPKLSTFLSMLSVSAGLCHHF